MSDLITHPKLVEATKALDSRSVLVLVHGSPCRRIVFFRLWANTRDNESTREVVLILTSNFESLLKTATLY